MFDPIVWNINPEIFSLDLFGFTFAPRWYGICFASGLLFGYLVMKKFFDDAGYKEEWLNTGFVMVAIGTIVGARLGHTLFYEPEYYLSHPIRILYVWEGGLASHGGTVGVFVAVLLFVKKYKIPFIWIADHIAVGCPLTAGFIRLGNFFNSEIVGKPTKATWGVIFEKVDQLPRHPAQLYEAISYFVLFLVLWIAYRMRPQGYKEGKCIGVMFIWIFGSRIFIEYFKENQVDFEKDMVLNMGQILSIPMVAVGFFLFFGGYGLLQQRFGLAGAGDGPRSPDLGNEDYAATKALSAKKSRRKLQKKAKRKR